MSPIDRRCVADSSSMLLPLSWSPPLSLLLKRERLPSDFGLGGTAFVGLGPPDIDRGMDHGRMDRGSHP
eukprot:3428036-Pyramimonas_sp.AAC.1